MAQTRVLRRLLRVRELAEEQSRLELEAAVRERERVAGQLAAVTRRQVEGRRTFVAGIGAEDTAGRSGALIEMEQASRMRSVFEPKLDVADAEVERARGMFQMRRTGRRQVETLLDQEHAKVLEEAGRRAQRMIDDWYGRRSFQSPDRRSGVHVLSKPLPGANARKEVGAAKADLKELQTGIPDCIFPMKSS